VLNNLGFVKTGIKFEGCDVYIGVHSSAQGDRLAPLFRRWLNKTVFRSNMPTVSDLYAVSRNIRAKLVSGEPLFN
jgi:hypothetical protein